MTLRQLRKYFLIKWLSRKEFPVGNQGFIRIGRMYLAFSWIFNSHTREPGPQVSGELLF